MNVLITKKLTPSHEKLMKNWGWDFDVMPALEITPRKIAKRPAPADAWIVTSRNSWPAIRKFVDQAPPFIFCIGTKIKSELTRARVSSGILGFNDMKSLTDALLVKKFRRLVYFCGDHHRQELDERIAGVTKLVTYESRLTYPVIGKFYDAVFVFSPRSAESLLKNNTFPSHTLFACIGSTTQSYLSAHGIPRTFCASSPDSDILLKEFRSKFRTGI